MDSSNSSFERCAIARAVGWRKVDERVVVADVSSGSAFIFEDIEAFIWQLIAEGMCKSEIAQEICATYEVERATAEADLAIFIEQLAEAGLIDGSA